jgi:hypothetical protein
LAHEGVQLQEEVVAVCPRIVSKEVLEVVGPKSGRASRGVCREREDRFPDEGQTFTCTVFRQVKFQGVHLRQAAQHRGGHFRFKGVE